MIPAAIEGETADTLLGGKVRIAQPADGYRVLVDPEESDIGRGVATSRDYEPHVRREGLRRRTFEL